MEGQKPIRTASKRDRGGGKAAPKNLTGWGVTKNHIREEQSEGIRENTKQHWEVGDRIKGLNQKNHRLTEKQKMLPERKWGPRKTCRSEEGRMGPFN